MNNELQSRATEMQYGTIQVTHFVHRGEIVRTDQVDITNHKILGADPYVEAATIIMTLLKVQQEASANKVLSFNVLFDKTGMPATVQVQDFQKLKRN